MHSSIFLRPERKAGCIRMFCVWVNRNNDLIINLHFTTLSWWHSSCVLKYLNGCLTQILQLQCKGLFSLPKKETMLSDKNYYSYQRERRSAGRHFADWDILTFFDFLCIYFIVILRLCSCVRVAVQFWVWKQKWWKNPQRNQRRMSKNEGLTASSDPEGRRDLQETPTRGASRILRFLK